jgi:NMD protein affecting ribosome stability and mRNA decay
LRSFKKGFEGKSPLTFLKRATPFYRKASKKECMTAHSSKVRLYDLAKELKQDTKRLIEEVRREGVDVSVPSNSVSKELADKIRNRYFPKKEASAPRKVVVVKRSRPVV